jgi:hypothetical protein
MVSEPNSWANLKYLPLFRVFHQREDKTQPAVKQAEAAEAKPSYPEHRSAKPRPARDPDLMIRLGSERWQL